jgi:hypothetical protein
MSDAVVSDTMKRDGGASIGKSYSRSNAMTESCGSAVNEDRRPIPDSRDRNELAPDDFLVIFGAIPPDVDWS